MFWDKWGEIQSLESEVSELKKELMSWGPSYKTFSYTYSMQCWDLILHHIGIDGTKIGCSLSLIRAIACIKPLMQIMLVLWYANHFLSYRCMSTDYLWTNNASTFILYYIIIKDLHTQILAYSWSLMTKLPKLMMFQLCASLDHASTI